MKLNRKLIEEVDFEVVNRQPNAQEKEEISAAIRASKKKLERLARAAEKRASKRASTSTTQPDRDGTDSP